MQATVIDDYHDYHEFHDVSVKEMDYLLISGGADVDLEGFRAGLELVGQCNIVAEETVL